MSSPLQLLADELANNLSPVTWLKEWLEEPGFLMPKLAAELDCQPNLEHRSSQWSAPDWWEQHALHLQCDQVYRREITVGVKDCLCWYARTIIPAVTFYTFADIFSALEQYSLGEVLAQHPMIRLAGRQHYAVSKDHVEYHWLDRNRAAPDQLFWCRLSEYRIEQHFCFYLIEIFLPGLQQCLSRK